MIRAEKETSMHIDYEQIVLVDLSKEEKGHIKMVQKALAYLYLGDECNISLQRLSGGPYHPKAVLQPNPLRLDFCIYTPRYDTCDMESYVGPQIEISSDIFESDGNLKHALRTELQENILHFCAHLH